MKSCQPIDGSSKVLMVSSMPKQLKEKASTEARRETVWKVGWRGVNEARSLACNAKIRSPCPSMLACVAPVWCPSGLSRQSLELDFGHSGCIANRLG